MRYSLLLALAVLTLAFACNKKVSDSISTSTPMDNNSSAVKTIALNQAESMRIGETCKLEKSDVMVTFVSVDLDSRCPKGVNCVQEGEAQVTLSVNGQPQRVTIDVNDKTTARLGIPGGSVEVLSLDPYPQAEVRVKPEDRRLRIRMVKSADM